MYCTVLNVEEVGLIQLIKVLFWYTENTTKTNKLTKQQICNSILYSPFSVFTLCGISLLQQRNQSGREDLEAWHHDRRSVHGRSQRDEDSAARQTGAALRRRHQDRAHLHHH